MLEVKNLYKTYYLKRAPETKALIDVSLKFENKGMVFVLGKSGSGKSTFLNVVGGLDKYDSGEIIIKGKSSREFTGSDFDSYRNTYLGFIFQEYNIIEEFSISANIALALQLQHKKASKEDVEKILQQVDMQGYADRYPNQISGGQRQRVAIARALIKEPQIIFADEPTGALDSATGEQIFQTLKKLSEDKLVIIVSHDREYAEMFGDRIIEFKDGRVISDMIKEESGFNEQIKTVDGALVAENLIKIPAGGELTQKHTDLIKTMLSQGELIISTNQNLNRYFADQFTEKKQRKGRFVDTKEEMLNLNEETSPFKLIKSRLPSKNARKMAASSMKHKKVRLAFSIILSIFAIMFFGFSNVLGNFNQRNVVGSVMRDYDYNHIVVSRSIAEDTLLSYSGGLPLTFTDKDIDRINTITDGGVADFVHRETSLPLSDSYPDPKYNLDYLSRSFYGVVAGDLTKLGLSVPEVYGRYPQNLNEILITNYTAQQMVAFGLVYYDPAEMAGYEYLQYKPEQVGDVLNYVVPLSTYDGTQFFKIVGIINFNIERYKSLMLNETIKDASTALKNEFKERKNFELSYIYGIKGLDKLFYTPYQGSNTFTHYNLPELYGAEFQPSIKMASYANYLNYNDNHYYDYNYLGVDGSKVMAEPKENEVIIDLNSFNTVLGMMSGKYEDSVVYSYDKMAEIIEHYGFFDPDFKLSAKNVSLYLNYEYSSVDNLKIIGAVSGNGYHYEGAVAVFSNSQYNELTKTDREQSLFVYLKNDTAINNFIKSYVGDFKFKKGLINSYSYHLPMSEMVSMVSMMFKLLSIVFFWMGIAFCVFAALLLLNFISTSVAYKRKEIGILRAIGARKADIISIFLWEGVFISLWVISFAVSLVFVATVVINNLFSALAAIPFTLLSFGVLDVVLMALVCFATIAVASIIPVSKISSKRPIDAIRG